MRKILLIPLITVMLVAIGLHEKIFSQELKKEDLFFRSSLHYTCRGMAYWYNKTNGGLETITEIPYSRLDCQNCHTPSCDTCHKAIIEGRPSYLTEAARNQEMCLKCHKREASILKIDKAANQEDVHFDRGMKCMNCHTAREMHGDETEYKSMKQKGSMDTTCEKCHESINPIASHKVHGERLDCKACHVRYVLSCSNCHFETLIKEGKRVSIPLSDWVFLMNYNGKVTSANMQNFVLPGNKTFLMFAPQNSHSIMREGRKCDNCHGTEIVGQIQKGRLSLTWFENGNIKHLRGVIPIVNSATYESVYQNYKDGKWIPIENPPVPRLQYAGFGEPLSKEQLNKLSRPMGKSE